MVRVGVAFAMGDLSGVGESLSILLVNLAGFLADGVLTLRGARVWARRSEAGQGIFRPNRGRAHDREGRAPPYS